ncbi:MAG: UDP-3-O-[3-hydroxymyristoyl] N-acetylglucosamine deacetylase [Planctomycetes bacterium]|nr:UDP-3-O-[3-hydroxymyristoyl] N-acetylglucosamine deacetylase [Planctomycetota bacterium]
MEFSGVGLFTGAPSRLRVEPAPPNSGLNFVRTDVAGPPRIPVHPDRVSAKLRRTALANGDVEVETVEHLLSALWGTGVDNAEIKVDASEVPHADGCSKAWADLILAAGFEEQKEPRRIYTVREPLAVSERDAHLVAFPSDEGLTINYALDYPNTAIGAQHLTLEVNEKTYPHEIAPARTFCLKSEAEALLAQGLGKGGTTANTLVVGPEGPIENELRWPDEYVRHKILDLVGDLAILGGGLRAYVVAVGSGHSTNVSLVRKIRDAMEGGATTRVRQGSVLDVREIEKILPHRYPMLLIDRVVEMDGYTRAVGIKNVTYNEPFFQGHFPGQPIMPGVLQIEAMAQLAGTLLMRKSESQARVAVLLSLDGVRLRKNVVPGDQLRIEIETLKLKARTAEVAGRATVDGQVACEAAMKFMLLDSEG